MPLTPTPHSTLPDQWSRRLSRWTMLIVLIGIALRLFRYVLKLPMNGDECAVGLNIINRSFTGLLHPLDYSQVAPVGFLWSERFIYQTLGMSEYAMRLLPTLAGIAALFFFAKWAKLLAAPFATFIATAIVATGLFTVQHGVEVKPYGYDLLASLLLLLPATLFLRNGSVKSLATLIFITPVALAISYPAVFVAGGVAVAIGLQLPGMRRWSQYLFLFFLFTLLASFGFITWHIGAGQYAETTSVMSQYWKDSFPPASPSKLMLWLISVHTGPMFACPIGGKNFLSTPNFLLFLLGLFTWRTTSKGSFAALLLIPFLLGLIASALHKYPYGQSERVAQHLVPAVALLIGIGISNLIDLAIKDQSRRRFAARAVLVVFLALALHVAIFNVRNPDSDQIVAARDNVSQMIETLGPKGLIAVAMPEIDVQVNTQWYLRESKAPIVWNVMKTTGWESTGAPVCVITSYSIPDLRRRFEARLQRPATIHQQWTIWPFGPPETWNAYIFPPAQRGKNNSAIQ